MVIYQAVPNDSRYIPFTQQEWCCVPTSIQMVMYRRNIPLIPSEEIGYHIGLTVPPDQAYLFYSARTARRPPTTAGFGTQMQDPKYDLNNMFNKLNIPLRYVPMLASAIKDEDALQNALKRIEEEDCDALLCFNPGVINGKYKPNSGHVVVFDKQGAYRRRQLEKSEMAFS